MRYKYVYLNKQTSLKNKPCLTAIAPKFHPPCLLVLLRKFALTFSFVKFDWFFFCDRFLHSCFGLTALKLTNESRDSFLFIL